MILHKRLYKEAGYLIGLLPAMLLTLKSFFIGVFRSKRKNVSTSVSDSSPYSDRFKGVPFLTIKDDGTLRCNSCMICVKNCPAECIHIESLNVNEGGTTEVPIAFHIELLRCSFCGICQQVCPIDAIRLSPLYAKPDNVEGEWLLDRHRLAFRQDLNNGHGIISATSE